MKKQLLFAIPAIVLGLSAQNGIAQTGYTVTGNIQGIEEPYIYLARPVADSFRVDSAAVTNGQFTFKGSVDEPSRASIMNKERSKGFSIYLENSPIQVSGNFDSLQSIRITGSATQKDADDLKAASAVIEQQEEAAYAKYQEAASKNDTAQQKIYEARLDSLDNANTAATKQFIKNHPNSFLNLSLLPQMAYSMEFPELNTLFSGLGNAVKNSSKGKKFAEHLAVLEKVQDGKPAIIFTQNDTANKPVSLADFKGKYVLVDFWASWCGPCRAENPNVVKAYNKYKDKNFTILGVSLDHDADKWKAAIEKDGLTWTEVSDLQYWKNAAAAQYGVQAIPANFLIDPKGTIVGHNLRGEDLDKKLAEVLN